MAHPGPAHYVGWTFRAIQHGITKDRNTGKDSELKVGDTGVIDGITDDGTMYFVTVANRFNDDYQSPYLRVPTSAVQIGKVFGEWTIKSGFPKVPDIGNRRPAGSENAQDMRKHLSALLVGFNENLTRITSLNQVQKRLIAGPAEITRTMTSFRDAVSKTSEKLLGVFNSKNFSYKDILRACKEIKKTNHDGGIYLRVYYLDDGKGGTDIYIYVGQTVDFAARQGSHDRDMWNEDGDSYMTEHYQIARKAKSYTAVVLCQVDEAMANGSKALRHALLDLFEQIFICLTGSQADKALRWVERFSAMTVAQAVAAQHKTRELTSMYAAIAKNAFKASGYAGGCGRKSFGVAGGLNTTSPFGGELGTHFEKVLWTRQEFDDRYTLNRPPITLSASGSLVRLGDRVADSQVLFIETLHQTGMVPTEGDLVYPSFEIMKPGDDASQHPHPAPYFRLPDAGPFSNWWDVNLIGFKITWKSKSDGEWYTRYLQSTAAETRYLVKSEDTNAGSKTFHEGGLARYAQGIALYQYFMRSRYPVDPGFYSNYGIADTLAVEVDIFNMTVTCSIDVKPVRVLTGPEKDINIPMLIMEEAGFDQVGGTLVRQPGQAGGQRKVCDSCLLANADKGDKGPYIHLPAGTACTKSATDSKRCTNCIIMGLTCSWTDSDRFGSFRKAEHKRVFDSEFAGVAVKCLFQAPINEEACTATNLKKLADDFDKLMPFKTVPAEKMKK